MAVIVSGLCAVSCGDPAAAFEWEPAFDTRDSGFLSGVWGSGPADVFVVGGDATSGEVDHYDGVSWSPMAIPEVGLLVWVFGFSPELVYAVGTGGAVLRYDGVSWEALDAGTDADLWGIWGSAPGDLWIVGGAVSAGEPVLLHYDGAHFERYHLEDEDNPLAVHALFKVFGVGDRLFAVGQRGLILQHQEGAWHRVSAGPAADDDFISLWGTAPDAIIAVGGRDTARVARYDGSSFETFEPVGLFGLNAVWTQDPETAFVGGIPGVVAELHVPSMSVRRQATTSDSVHAMWGDGHNRVYAVGGVFAPPYRGIALVHELE